MKKLSINKNFFFDIIRATIIATIVTLVLVLIFALIVNLTDIGEKAIMPVNEVIKVISLLAGCFIGFKSNKQGILKGGLTGLLFTILSVLIFGLISKTIKINMLTLAEIGLGIVTGAICGILTVNLKRKSVTD